MADELEWKTRRDRINKKLKALHPPWTIIRYSDHLDPAALTRHAVEEYQTANGPADYALFVKGRLLGIIEAKKVRIGPQNVLEQAKRYARGAFNNIGNWNGFRVPSLCASNGETIWFVDVRHPKNLARRITAFHTPAALAEFFEEDATAHYEHLSKASPEITGLRFQLADQITNRYHKAKTHIDNLTQSILAKAFRGELVPQDPNDEPAGELLKRIRAEKAEAENKTRKKTSKERQKKPRKTGT